MPTKRFDKYEYGVWKEGIFPSIEEYLLKAWDGVVLRRKPSTALSQRETEESDLHCWYSEGWIMVRFVSETRWYRGQIYGDLLPCPALLWSSDETLPTNTYFVTINLTDIGNRNINFRVENGRLLHPSFYLERLRILSREMPSSPPPNLGFWQRLAWYTKPQRADWSLPLQVKAHDELSPLLEYFPTEFVIYPELSDTLKELGLPEVLCSNPPPPDECLWVGYEGE
jgi:hypothetical protein